MRVVPLAADSLGVRSMATYVEAGGAGILIDPGATLAPARYELPPAEVEWDALRRANDRISAYALRASLVLVSHYHEEHFRSEPGGYAGRTVLLKDPRLMVGGRQALRARALWRSLDGVARVHPADGWVRQEPGLRVEVSGPLAHGLEGSPLGHVVALTVADEAERERFVFASDVQGPLSAVVTAYLIRQRPTLLYLSGPASYAEREVGAASVDRAVSNLLRILDATGCRVLFDHYALRDPRAPERFARLWETGRVTTAAGHLGLPETPLEARRHELWGAVRRPGARAEERRAILGRVTRRLARGGGPA